MARRKKKDNSSLRTRVITSVVGLPILIGILALGGVWLVVGVLILTLVGTLEFSSAINHLIIPRISYAFMLILSFLMVVTIKLDYNFGLPMLLICFIIMFCYEIATGKLGIQRTGSMLLGIVYVPVMFSHLFLFETISRGIYYLWLIFVIAFVTDTAAYFVGRFFGNRKLAPKISPKKTIAGSIGGIIFAALAAMLYGNILRTYFDFDLAWYWYIGIGVLGSIAGQCGDLTASMIKRKAKIKDFSQVLPGHGGVLDRFDSIIFIIPIIYIFARLTFGMT
ncbi:phosphatidate cytidylyltransferase [Eubacteriaceae bacterium ES2]|nr:phosphatidate cytidylyltransferase [Eubacteriaceae bacterium ES2]